MVEGSQEMSSSDLLVNASASLALRGILVSRSSSSADCVKLVVLSPPSDVRLTNPILGQVDDVVHFSSQNQSDKFHRSLDNMGYNLLSV